MNVHFCNNFNCILFLVFLWIIDRIHFVSIISLILTSPKIHKVYLSWNFSWFFVFCMLVFSLTSKFTNLEEQMTRETDWISFSLNTREYLLGWEKSVAVGIFWGQAAPRLHLVDPNSDAHSVNWKLSLPASPRAFIFVWCIVCEEWQ